MKKLLMECIGTFFFLLMVAVGANPLAIAAMYMAFIYIGGFVSGAHYNPMVTLAHAIRNKFPWGLVPHYIVAQIIGGFLAFVVAAFLGYEVTLQHPGSGVGLFQAFLVEVLLSFVLALIILTVTTSEKFRGSHIFGFAIGFALPALITLGAPISGGVFNPALAIGSALYGAASAMQTVVWPNVGMYVVGACLGGILAAYAYDYFE